VNDLLHLGWIHGGADDGARFEVDPQIMLDDCLIVGASGSGKTTLARRLLEEHLRLGCPVVALDTRGDLSAWLERDFGLAVSVNLPAADQGAQLRLASADLDDFAQLFELPQIAKLPRLVTALLGILHYKARPGTPEHALIEAIVAHSWQSGVGVPLPRLAELVIDPPIRTLGVFEVDRAVPPERRAQLGSSIISLLETALAWGAMPARAPSLTDLLSAADRPAATVLSFGQQSLRVRRFIVEVLLAMIEYTNPRMLLILDEADTFLPPGEPTPTSKLLAELLQDGTDFSRVGLVLVTAEPADLKREVTEQCETWIAGRLPSPTSRRPVVEALDLVNPPVDEVALDRALAGLSGGQHVLRSVRLEHLVTFRTTPHAD